MWRQNQLILILLKVVLPNTLCLWREALPWGSRSPAVRKCMAGADGSSLSDSSWAQQPTQCSHEGVFSKPTYRLLIPYSLSRITNFQQKRKNKQTNKKCTESTSQDKKRIVEGLIKFHIQIMTGDRWYIHIFQQFTFRFQRKIKNI